MKKVFASLALISALVIYACSGDGSNAPTASTGTGAATTKDACIGATSKWALWSGGVCLRGANVWQRVVLEPYYGGTLGKGAYGPPYSQADFDALSAMGANVVNISGPGIFTETAPYVLNQAALDNLDSVLKMVEKANMFAVITFRTGPGRNEEDIVPQAALTTLNSVWLNKNGEQAAWVEMWKYAANYYKNKPIVVGYDLMCEPHPNTIVPGATANTEDVPAFFYTGDPKTTYAGTSYDWNPLAKKISYAIRQVDTTTPILIGGMNYSQAAWLGSLTSNGDGKTVYTVHQYAPAAYTHQLLPITGASPSYGTAAGTYTRAKDLETYYGYMSAFKLAHNVPVGNNEFGVERFAPGADQWLNDSMDLMESIGVNYNVFVWDPTDPAWASIDGYDSWNFRRGSDPNNHVDMADISKNPLAAVVQKYLKKNTVRPSNRGF